MAIVIPEPLRAVADAVRKGETPSGVTTRDLLSWFGVQHRGRIVNNNIRKALRKTKVRTEPRFHHTYLGASLTFLPVRGDGALPETTARDDQDEQTPPVLSASGLTDPTFRIGKLDSANHPPLAVGVQTTVREPLP